MLENELNEMYEKIANELDISDSLREKAIKSYNALGEYLDNNIENSVVIYPQGSFNLGTIIKPINENDDYDIDLVCQVNNEYYDASLLKNSVGDVLKQSERYKRMLEKEGKRCWTIKYSEDAHFHIDILPSQDGDNIFDDSIKITNKENGIYTFKSSNPKGYANWFFEKQVGKNTNDQRYYDSVEKIRKQGKKTPLQKTIQILKRHRDIIYSNKSEEEKENKPISIIITTLATKLYTGKENVYELIKKFALDSIRLIEKDEYGNDLVRNPVDENENFADKWIKEPKRRDAFYKWVADLRNDLIDNNYLLVEGKIEQSDRLKSLFGENIIKNIYLTSIDSKSRYIDHSKSIASLTDQKTDIKVADHHFYGKNN